jgi:hypothetical protein
MGLLLLGKIFLIGTMAVVMVSPFLFYLRRDLAWEASKDHAPEEWHR